MSGGDETATMDPARTAGPADPVVRRLSADEVRERADELAELLIDAVDGGASVSYLPPLKPLDAIGWTLDVADAIGRRRMVFVAEIEGVIVGSVQLIRAVQPNQPHRADVVKLLVHRRCRGRGIARALMSALEHAARQEGITLLTLDTAARGEARGFFERLGWTPAGVVPGYALGADGAPVDTLFCYRTLG